MQNSGEINNVQKIKYNIPQTVITKKKIKEGHVSVTLILSYNNKVTQ